MTFETFDQTAPVSRFLACENDRVADWTRIGVPRWYDCKLGTMGDKQLAAITGSTRGKIRYRRELFNIPAWNIGIAIAPYSHLLGCRSDAEIGRKADVSPSSVKTYRESLGIKAHTRVAPGQRIPVGHLIKPYSALLGLIEDEPLATLSGVTVNVVTELRESLRIAPCKPLPQRDPLPSIENYVGPLLGYESMFYTTSDAKISRATGVPITIIEKRRLSLAVPLYQRKSRLTPYEHLLGLVSNNLLAKLVGLSVARIYDIRKNKGV
ncbi:hypothetical protein RGV33_33010 [Pseudomonas sp. Bout1]|uniref:hypothetical protein n=1 Tax=Pseudomonas sp. Bout1 TaxID=3048600 RepID=UPI002AB5AF58|nr:hypothetical protein [Pseudomonas sp. Bout1]MDY7536444.1 hypothetical protein [Pseudomonas sp. Bout1]MEB0187493.1 hypothetical protein [Pseudomonas sp. Bout1]